MFCTILVLKRKVSWLHKFTFQATADITGRRFLISCQYPQITRITLPLVAPPTFVSCFIRQSNCQSHWTQVDRAPLSSFIANNLTRHPAAATTEILISIAVFSSSLYGTKFVYLLISTASLKDTRGFNGYYTQTPAPCGCF